MLGDRLLDLLLPEGRRLVLDEIAASATEVRHRQVAQDADHHQIRIKASVNCTAA